VGDYDGGRKEDENGVLKGKGHEARATYRVHVYHQAI